MPSREWETPHTYPLSYRSSQYPLRSGKEASRSIYHWCGQSSPLDALRSRVLTLPCSPVSAIGVEWTLGRVDRESVSCL